MIIVIKLRLKRLCLFVRRREQCFVMFTVQHPFHRTTIISRYTDDGRHACDVVNINISPRSIQTIFLTVVRFKRISILPTRAYVSALLLGRNQNLCNPNLDHEEFFKPEIKSESCRLIERHVVIIAVYV